MLGYVWVDVSMRGCERAVLSVCICVHMCILVCVSVCVSVCV